MNEQKTFISELKIPIILTICILLLGSIVYFTSAEKGMNAKTSRATDKIISPSFYEGLRIKTVYTDNSIKIFATAKNNELKKLAAEGDNIPEIDTIVIGYDEAAMMKEEKLFSKPGDRIDGLFGIDTTVGGILAKTDTVLDYFHFVSDKEFTQVEGKEGKAYIMLDDEQHPELHYTYLPGEKFPFELEFTEGNLDIYDIHDLGGTKYYPLILGAKEAAMMRSEKEFTDTGNIIQGFFGKNVVVVGVLKETDSALDILHITPFKKDELQSEVRQ